MGALIEKSLAPSSAEPGAERGGAPAPDLGLEVQRLREENARYRRIIDDLRAQAGAPLAREEHAEHAEIIRAIRGGEIDALVMDDQGEDAIFSVRRFDRGEREALYEALLGAVQDHLFVTDRDGRCVFANRKLLELWRVDAATALGKTMRELGTPAEVEAVIDGAIREVIVTRRVVKVETTTAAPDGQARCLENLLAPVVGPDGPTGDVRWIVGSSRDVTERKRLADALRDADRHKDEFLATLAHELRNPLAPIRYAVQLLSQPEAADPRRLLAMIDRQVNHMVRLVDDLMDVSRIARGKLALRLEEVELGAVLDQALTAARLHGPCGDHDLSVAVPAAVRLRADPVRLAQVFSNVLHNACKYTPKGGQIWVSATVDGPWLEARFRDNGSGIAKEQLPRVFELFAQVEATLGQAQGGLGIGLSLARSLVELHGGTISAHSAGRGQGSEFVVRLPVVVPAAAASAVTTDAATAAPRGLRVLVVDDNRDVTESLADLLRSAGHEVFQAHDGLAAVAAVAALGPDVVLLDLGLPVLDGYEACRRIRALPGGAKLPLIAQTGWGSAGDRRRTAEAGFDAHLVKPVDPATLEQLLAALFRREG